MPDGIHDAESWSGDRIVNVRLSSGEDPINPEFQTRLTMLPGEAKITWTFRVGDGVRVKWLKHYATDGEAVAAIIGETESYVFWEAGGHVPIRCQ